MKVASIIVLVAFLQGEVFAQIPNGGFEDWEQIQDYENPLHWETNQYGYSTYKRFEKDTLSVEGNYSLKIVPGSFSAWYQCVSHAWTEVNLQMPIGENKSLTFFAKSIPDSLDHWGEGYVFLRVEGELFSAGSFKGSFEWYTYERIDDFTKIQIPIAHSNIDSLTIEIRGGALNGATDGCPHRSYSWIDGFGIEDTEISSTNAGLRPNKESISIFPNPSSGIIEIEKIASEITTYYLYSFDGKLIDYGNLSGQTTILEIKQNGIFFLRLTDENQSFEVSQKIIIH